MEYKGFAMFPSEFYMRWSRQAIFQADFFIGCNVAEERVYCFGLNTMFAFDRPDNLEQIFVHQLKSLVHMMVDLFNIEREKKTTVKVFSSKYLLMFKLLNTK